LALSVGEIAGLRSNTDYPGKPPYVHVCRRPLVLNFRHFNGCAFTVAAV